MLAASRLTVASTRATRHSSETRTTEPAENPDEKATVAVAIVDTSIEMVGGIGFEPMTPAV